MALNKAVKEERYFTVQTLILTGVSNYEIAKTCSREWDITERQVYKYIKVADERIEKAYEEELKGKVSWHFIARRKLYYKAIKSENYALAEQILKDIGELQGLYKTKITGDETDPVIVKIITAAAEMGMGE